MRRLGKYPRHRRTPLEFVRQFGALCLLSLISVGFVALLSRAELRLSGDVFQADGKELSVLEELQPFSRVELIRETEDLRLYLLDRGEDRYLAHVVKRDGVWVLEKVEKVHR